MRDPQLLVDLGRDEGRAQPREDERVDRARVAVALQHDLVAVVRERESGREVALRGAVDQEPGARARPRPRRRAAAPARTASASGRCRCPR